MDIHIGRSEFKLQHKKKRNRGRIIQCTSSIDQLID